jgi:hypothetical protein
MNRSISIAFAAALGAVVAGTAFGQASGVQPGKWEIAVTVNSMEMSGVPAGVAKMMVGKTTRIKHCITPAEAARGPQALLATGKSCVFSKYSLIGGRLNSEFSCKSGGQTTNSASSGTFAPTEFRATGRSVTTGSTPMTMTSTSVGHRVGDCK